MPDRLLTDLRGARQGVNDGIKDGGLSGAIVAGQRDDVFLRSNPDGLQHLNVVGFERDDLVVHGFMTANFPCVALAA